MCECIRDFHGDPYAGCRPECVLNSDCSRNLACINSKCQDPCPGVCGSQAICTVTNHIPICSCPAGLTGDAFRACILYEERRPQVETNPCVPSPCGSNANCRVQGSTAICECAPGYFGNPFAGGCRPECSVNSDCAQNKACVNLKCVDPCPGTCGYQSVCHVHNHSPICSCPKDMIGDPFTGCRQPPQPADPCLPNPCGPNGICRTVNGAASCSYPECVTNADCSPRTACVNQRCVDPCPGSCGVNAICEVVNHHASCLCPPGYVGSPYERCVLQDVPAPPQPRPECVVDDECSRDKACINQQCQDPCALDRCGPNADCRVQNHRPLCVCRDGFEGNGRYGCHEIGCRADSECPPTEACVNRECVDVCRYTQCGENAVCRSDYNHRARCECRPGFYGNPLISCTRPECVSDDECPYNLACINERCRDPCNCGQNALCRVDNHRALCSCPPGYEGDAGSKCSPVAQAEPQCRTDGDCPSQLACFSGVCKNPCIETKPCAPHASCSVVDTLPLRTMVCTCDPGYVGDAEKLCVLRKFQASFDSSFLTDIMLPILIQRFLICT